ncbi:hypothetical protein [Halobacterium yunchengense]|uniref:hypothetical protein n=1 Tax=Halobacterium yunchengense TaxID=3108497 RepID=UPI003009412B
MTSTRERLGWALLFGLPVGAGVALATARMGRTGLADPLVVGAGVGFAALVGGLLWAATSVNQAPPGREGAP